MINCIKYYNNKYLNFYKLLLLRNLLMRHENYSSYSEFKKKVNFITSKLLNQKQF